jgi:hypothetical protein
VFGTVERLPSKRYRAYYKHDGRRIYAHGTFDTKADASGWPANTETDLGRGTWVDPRRGQEPFHHYAGTWMIRSDLAGSTRGEYDGLLRLHVLPTFGQVKLGRLAGAAGMVRTWYYELDRRYPDGSTANDAYRCLRAIVNTAVADSRMSKSPCTVREPARPKPRSAPWPP